MKPKMTTSYAPYAVRLIPRKFSKEFPREIVHDFQRAENVPQLDLKMPPWIPAFLAPADKDKIEQDSSRLRELFFESTQEGQEEEELKELWEPKPPNEMKYCDVCEKSFEEYLVHINCEEHMNNMETNEFILALRSESRRTQEEFRNDEKKELADEQTESNVPNLFSQEVNPQKKIESSNLNCKTFLKTPKKTYF